MGKNTATEQTQRDRLKTSREEMSRELAKSMCRNNIGDQRLSDLSGNPGRQVVGLWRDSENERTPTIAHLAIMPREVAVDMLRVLAGKFGVVLSEAPDFDDVADHAEHLHTVIKEFADVTTGYARRVATRGATSAADRRNLMRDIDEAVSAALALKGDLEAEDSAKALDLAARNQDSGVMRRTVQ